MKTETLTEDKNRLTEIVLSDGWFRGVLEIVRDCYLPQGAVGAGALRNVVWDHLQGGGQKTPPADVDVVYWDEQDLRSEREDDFEGQLNRRAPSVPWQVRNQARVHLWYERKFGTAILPFHSLQEAVATWPEIATAVAVRLRDDGTLDVIAPLGLDDLLGMVLRRNPALVTVELYRRRLADKRISEKWPAARIVYE